MRKNREGKKVPQFAITGSPHSFFFFFFGLEATEKLQNEVL